MWALRHQRAVGEATNRRRSGGRTKSCAAGFICIEDCDIMENTFDIIGSLYDNNSCISKRYVIGIFK